MNADKNIPDEKPLAMMTAGDLRRLIAEEWQNHLAELTAKPASEPAKPEKRYIVTLKAMAEYLGMNEKTFNRNRQRGVFDGVIAQVGNFYRAKPADLDAAINRHIY